MEKIIRRKIKSKLLTKKTEERQLNNRKLTYKGHSRLKSDNLPIIRRIASKEALEGRLNSLRRGFSEAISPKSPSGKIPRLSESRFEIYSSPMVFESNEDSSSEIFRQRQFNSSYINIVKSYAQTKKSESSLETSVRLAKLKKMQKIKIRVVDSEVEDKDSPEILHSYRFKRIPTSISCLKTVSLRGIELKDSLKRPSSCRNSVFVNTGRGLLLLGNCAISEDLRIWRLNPKTFDWSKLDLRGEKQKFVCGSSVALFENRLYLFGSKNKAFSPEILVFDILKSRFKTETCSGAALMPLRRYHCSFVVGKNMVVYGGVDVKGEVVGDAWVLDLDELAWKPLKTKGELPCLAGMACVTAINPNLLSRQSYWTVYSMPDVSKASGGGQQGVYLFGGKGETEYSGELYCFRLGKPALNLKKIKTKGNGPKPRRNASLDYSFEKDMLILYGGEDKKRTFSDIFAFCLKKKTWYGVEVQGAQPKQRSSHSSCLVKDKLIVFGGMGDNIFLGGDCFIIDLKIV